MLETAADTRTIEERERLMTSSEPPQSAFLPHRSKSRAVKKPSTSMLKIECSQFVEATADQTTHGYPTLDHRLWLEAGKHRPAKPSRPDPQFSSNVWRNFKQAYGFPTEKGGQNMSDIIADMYPVNIPPPSRVGSYTYSRFLTETPLIRDAKYKRLAISKIEQDDLEMKQMRLHSDVRNPPLNERGDILPPSNFKRYEPHLLPPLSPNEDESAQRKNVVADEEQRNDLFGQQIPLNKSQGPFIWKMRYRANHPNIDAVAMDMYNRRLRHIGIKIPVAGK